MRRVQIKVGHENQADKPVILRPSGVLACGRFLYRGPLQAEFRAIHNKILELVPVRGDCELLDVSHYQYWDAVRIYDELVAARWARSIGAKRLEKLAIETAVFLLLEPVRAEFRRAVGRRWKRIFLAWDQDDPNRPRYGWQIL